MAFTEDLITRLRADTTDFESKLGTAQRSTQSFGNNWDRGAQKFGRASIQIIGGLSDIGRKGADVGQIVGRMSLDVADLAEGIGRVAGLSTTMIAGIAGIGGAVAVLLPLAIDLGKKLFDVGKAAETVATKEVPKATDAFAAMAEEIKKATEASVILRQTEIRNALLRSVRTGNLLKDLEAAAKAEQVWRETIQFLTGDTEKSTAAIEKRTRAIRESNAASGFAGGSAERGETLIAAIEAPRLFQEETGIAGASPELMAMMQETEQQRLDLLMRRSEVTADLVGLELELAAATDINMLATEQESAALEKQAAALARSEAAHKMLMSALRATAKAGTEQALTAIAVGVAEGKSAADIGKAIAQMGRAEAARHVALAIAAAIFEPAAVPVHLAAAAAWTVAAGIGSAVGSTGGGGGRRSFNEGTMVARGGAPSPAELGSEREGGPRRIELHVYVPMGGAENAAREMRAALRSLADEEGVGISEVLAN